MLTRLRNRIRMEFFVILVCFTGLISGQCPAMLLEESSDMLTKAFCGFYTQSLLAKFIGFYLAPNANVTFSNYDPVLNICLPPIDIPIAQWLPMMFRVDHTCLALIPVHATATEGLVSVHGFVEHILVSLSTVRDITFVFTQSPSSGCNLVVQSIMMKDLQCVVSDEPTSSSSTSSTSDTTSPTDTSSDTQSNSSSSSSTSSYSSSSSSASTHLITRTTSGTSRTRTSPVDDRYTRITGGGLEYGSQEYHQFSNGLNSNPLAQLCRFRRDNLRLIVGQYTNAQAELVCLRAGFKLARITRENLRDAIMMTGTCLGPDSGAWIRAYWRSVPPRSCLEVRSGQTQRSGGISMAGDCDKLQSVLCEDPFIPLI